MVSKGRGIQRQCAGCFQKERPTEMERFALNEDGYLIHDIYGKIGGRGVHVHLDPTCWARACSGGFNRSLRGHVEIDSADALKATVRGGILRRIRETLRASYRSVDAFIGETKVREAIKNGTLRSLFLAIDAGQATQSRYKRNAERKGIQIVDHLFDRHTLGSLVGFEDLVLYGVGGVLAEKLDGELSKLDKLANLEKM